MVIASNKSMEVVDDVAQPLGCKGRYYVALLAEDVFTVLPTGYSKSLCYRKGKATPDYLERRYPS